MVIFIAYYGVVLAQGGGEVSHAQKESRICVQNIAEWLRMLEIRESPGLMEDLADCYVRIEDDASAAKWYGESLEKGNDDADCRRKHAIALKSIGRYDEAIAQMEHYAAQTGITPATVAFIANCTSLQTDRFSEGRFEVERLPQLCSRQAEVMACRHEDEIYFYSRSPRRHLGKSRLRGASHRAYSLYAVPASAFASRRHVRVVSRNSNPMEKSLGMVWDQSCKDYYVVKSERTAVGENPPAIFRSWLDFNGLVHEEKLLLNGPVSNSNFHPAISPNGRMMVFASDREGGFGGADLYACYRQKDQWSEPTNLGELINTVQEECYPSFSADGRLYFSSNGLDGFGKRDIYYSEYRAGAWSAAVNVGAAVNSGADDFAMVWNPAADGNTGYFTSDRDSGYGCNIYTFIRHPEIVGSVLDAATGAPLPAVQVSLTAPDAASFPVAVDPKGHYSAFIDDGRKYYLEAHADGYEGNTWEVDAAAIGQGNDLHFDLKLDPLRSYTLQGSCRNLLTGEGMDHVSLRIINAQTGEVIRYDGSLESDFEITLAPGADYALLFQKPGFNSAALQLPLSDFKGRKVEERMVQMSPGKMILLVGIVTDAAGHRLQGVSRIDVVNMKSKAVLQQGETDQQGNFSLWIPRDVVGRYALFASHPGVATSHIHILADDDQYVPFHLDEVALSLSFASNELLHDFGQKGITASSQETLDDIYFFLLHNPLVSLELRTYTDARGAERANEQLSEQRALAIINDLLLRGGITPDRLRHAFFGEMRPKNECVDGVDCPEEKHAVNRRTEVYFFKAAPAEAYR